jgi:hypothetical protein
MYLSIHRVQPHKMQLTVCQRKLYINAYPVVRRCRDNHTSIESIKYKRGRALDFLTALSIRVELILLLQWQRQTHSGVVGPPSSGSSWSAGSNWTAQVRVINSYSALIDEAAKAFYNYGCHLPGPAPSEQLCEIS